ncbi:MAG: hypothetical protein PHD01_14285 [Geobacteraceae bacterium]|nr:hypothetical protein [Geobacteraceae bacterium]
MEASDCIAISAAVIALASLYVAVEQTRLSRKHNRLSVRPFLSIYRKQFKNHPVEYVLENRGLGPAVIKKFSVLVDNCEVDAANENVLLHALDLLSLSRDGVGGNLPGKAESLIAGQSIAILQFGKSKDDPALYQTLLNELPRLKFSIQYQSMYEEDFTYVGSGD